jgi:hypothetical protein
VSVQPSALIVAPFWRQQGHVGVYRVDRFVRWLSGAGVRVVVLRGGRADAARTTDWGVEVTIRDPLGLYPESAEGQGPAVTTGRRPNSLRRSLGHLAFVPDPTIVWARRAAGHRLLRTHCPTPAWVIASSPPESAHVAAALLVSRLGGRLVVDLRDGWLDEPLRSVLRRPGLRRWWEGRLERRVLGAAATIFVTSPVWRALLERRLPWTAGRLVELTNGYPLHLPEPPVRTGVSQEPLQLLHAGRFAGSRRGQSVDALLSALWAGGGACLGESPRGGGITLLGALEEDDREQAMAWHTRLEACHWQLRVEAPVSRESLFARYARADGLLLLAASRAAVPSKLFEYLPLRRPILSVTPAGSAVDQLTLGVPQVFRTAGADDAGASAVVRAFLGACRSPDPAAAVPRQFAESDLSARFLEALGA